MKKEYKIFFAIPFDALTKKIYQDICADSLKKYFESKSRTLITVIGNQQVSPSQEYSDIITFKAQNSDLHKQFFKDIAESDIVVADLTNNNPNVHLELGIALTLNKNILRVTGRSTRELGFDIRNLEVQQYKDNSELFEKIKKYLDTFLKIKELGFSPEYQNLYRKLEGPQSLPGPTPDVKENSLVYTLPINQGLLKDSALRMKFRFLYNLNDNSWFGVYFRAAREFLSDSYLLYIRKNGLVELGVYPGPIIEVKHGLSNCDILNRDVELLMEIENDTLEVKINNEILNFPKLRSQGLGNIVIATWECRAQFANLELINRDTIELFKD